MLFRSDHKNGFQIKDEQYLEDVNKAAKWISSDLFRPPYGRLRSSQARKLDQYRIIMWDVLSGDFDPLLSREKCIKMVNTKARSGSIIVFHDSEKAREKLEFVLPQILAYFREKGYRFENLLQSMH